jgi:hypothetical protein
VPLLHPAQLKAVARATRWFHQSISGRVWRSAEIARREALPKGYVAAVMRLAFLFPTVVNTVVEGRALAGISLQQLVNNWVALHAWLTAQVGV